MDPIGISDILAEAEESLSLAKKAYANRKAVDLLQNLILCSAAVVNALAIVALNRNSSRTAEVPINTDFLN